MLSKTKSILAAVIVAAASALAVPAVSYAGPLSKAFHNAARPPAAKIARRSSRSVKPNQIKGQFNRAANPYGKPPKLIEPVPPHPPGPGLTRPPIAAPMPPPAPRPPVNLTQHFNVNAMGGSL